MKERDLLPTLAQSNLSPCMFHQKTSLFIINLCCPDIIPSSWLKTPTTNQPTNQPTNQQLMLQFFLPSSISSRSNSLFTLFIFTVCSFCFSPHEVTFCYQLTLRFRLEFLLAVSAAPNEISFHHHLTLQFLLPALLHMTPFFTVIIHKFLLPPHY